MINYTLSGVFYIYPIQLLQQNPIRIYFFNTGSQVMLTPSFLKIF